MLSRSTGHSGGQNPIQPAVLFPGFYYLESQKCAKISSEVLNQISYVMFGSQLVGLRMYPECDFCIRDPFGGPWFESKPRYSKSK